MNMASPLPDQAAIDRWRQAIRSDTLAHYQYQMGVALTRTDDGAAAIASLERALALQPRHAGARLRLIRALEAAPGGAPRAKALREEGARIDPHFQATGELLLLADELPRAGAAPSAAQIIRQAQVKGIPDSVRGPILQELGRALLMAGSLDQAETALMLAKAAMPVDAGTLAALADLQLRRGDLALLAETLAAWQDMAHGNADFLFHRARLHSLRLNFEAADADFVAALEAGYKPAPIILSCRMSCRLAARDPAGALALFEKADQGSRSNFLCRAYALIAHSRLGGAMVPLAEVEAQLSGGADHPLARIVKCLAQQRHGGDWRSSLDQLLQDTPNAFTFATAAALECNAGVSPAVSWQKALHFNKVYARFYVMCLSGDYEKIIQ